MATPDLGHKQELGIEMRELHIPVSLAPGEPTEHEVYAELCVPADGAPTVVQVLLHGAIYNGTYWDFPYQPERYSYVDHMVSRGYATLNVDRIGNGRSTRPHSTRVDLDSNAFVIHQLVTALRDGSLGRPFERVVLAGHSYGTLVASRAAAVHGDVDALILTSALHTTSPAGAAAMGGNIAAYAASQEPKFAHLDDGYKTSKPGTRAEMLYLAENADPAVIALDEELKETVSFSEMAHLERWQTDDTTRGVAVPTLVAVGDHDIVWCGPDAVDCSTAESVRAAEAKYYAPEAQLEVFVLRDSGHDLNLQLNSDVWFAAATDWLAARARTWAPASEAH
ncbi:alpha/beta hydrolase [Amycolatopsis pithecellobii]|nr:alpha/beta hydrolase [Amycolatopsis pithecellobii]